MSTLSAFKDGDAWAQLADGSIVGRARNGSWAERVRAGVPIDLLVEGSVDGLYAPAAPAVAGLPEEATTVHLDYNATYGRFADWDFDAFFAPVESRRAARARRTDKKAAKPLKYGPKASKAHTVAAKILAEPVEPSVHTDVPQHDGAGTTVVVPCPPTRSASPVAVSEEEGPANLLRRFNAISVIAREWLADMADFADDVEITEEDWELERQLQRQRDARYER